MVKKTMELKVMKVEDKTVNTEDIHGETYYTLTAKAKDGLPKLKLTSEDPFEGFGPKDTIKVTIETEQTKLKK
jgi:hypothetical protein